MTPTAQIAALRGAPFNLTAHVLAAGAARPDHMALQILRPTGAERWSYGRLIAAIRGSGTLLLAQGLEPGDRVLLRLGNGPAFPLACLGAMAAGLVPVITSAQLTVPEITAMARPLGCRLTVADEGVALPEDGPPVLPARALNGTEERPPCDWHMGAADRPGYIVFTSGTTGRPLAVEHAHRAILARAFMHQGWEGLGPSDRLLHAGAFNWTYTLGTGLMDPWTLGATALIPGAGVTPAQLPLLLKRFDVTFMAAAPGVFRQMLRNPLPALPRLRHGLSAGETLSPDLRRQWRVATGTDLHEAFGLSECSTFVSGSPARPAPEGCVGFPQPGRQIALRDGVIAVHRSDPGLMLGYAGDPEATAARFAGDWFLTGDLAEPGPEGAFRTLGRRDDQMNPGGFRVSPLEVEAALAGLPGVAECAVAEVAVQPGVTVIACFFTAQSENEPVQTERLSAFAQARLARYKCPRIWQQVDRLPRIGNGKLDRRALPSLWTTA